MYKLVAIDLDGTLLNSYGEVSENTKNEIKKAVQNGIEVVLASGRPISSVEDLANDFDIANIMNNITKEIKDIKKTNYK